MVYTVLINCQQIDIPKANVEYIPSQTQNECGKNCESRQVASHSHRTRVWARRTLYDIFFLNSPFVCFAQYPFYLIRFGFDWSGPG